MNDKLPFEDAFKDHMNDLPLPGEDQAWGKMQQLLDKEDRRLLPPIFYLSSLVWLVFTSAILFGIWKYFTPVATGNTTASVIVNPKQHKNYKKTNETGIVNNDASSNSKSNETAGKANETETISDGGKDNTLNKFNDRIDNNLTGGSKSTSLKDVTSTNSPEKVNSYNKTKIDKNTSVTKPSAKDLDNRKNTVKNVSNKEKINKTEAVKINNGGNADKKVAKNKVSISAQPLASSLENNSSKTNIELTGQPVTDNNPSNKTIKASNDVNSKSVEEMIKTRVPNGIIKREGKTLNAEVKVINDSSVNNPTSVTNNLDHVIKPDTSKTLASTETKKINSNYKKFFIKAGLGVQYQIPVAGQKTVTSNLNGNSNLLSDYIPSLFVHFERDKKWFIRGEFVYASPHLVKEIPFSRQTVLDFNASTITTTTLRLQKTYYSEIPISINYYLKPGWSVGVGGSYNILKGSIVDKEVSIRNLIAQPVSTSKQLQVTRGFTDSFLYKSYSHLLLQSDYQFKNISLGIKYSRSFQPFITYTLPDGRVEDKRNWSLEFILRLSLWRSKNF